MWGGDFSAGRVVPIIRDLFRNTPSFVGRAPAGEVYEGC